MLYKGQRKQLEYEANAAKNLELKWDTVALHTEDPQNDFEMQIPKMFRSRLLLRVYGWIYAIKQAKNYDFVLFRDLQLDPLGPFFGLLVKNRITVHHAKEMEELAILRGGGLFSSVAVFLEKFIKPLTMRSARGLIGVTEEIKDYEVNRFPHLRDNAFVMPNGFFFEAVEPADLSNLAQDVNVAFVCAEFTVWHGLDRLLGAVKGCQKLERRINIHLVGDLNQDQLLEVNLNSSSEIQFICHGLLEKTQLEDLLSRCDLAIGSLALDRQGLNEAATLKTREYLAAGLPVYATHKDTALPEEFPFFFNDIEGVSIERMMSYLDRLGSIEKKQVCDQSKSFLDKASIMQKIIGDLGVLLSR